MTHLLATTRGLALAVGISASASAAVTIDWVTIGDPGNAAQSAANRTHSYDLFGDGYGAVADTFRMSRNETTLADYADFLNVKAASDPYGLWVSNMADYGNIAGITRSGTAGSYTYSVTGSGLRPITYVSWFNAARFANWIHNGQGSGDTETGAYTLNGATSGAAPAKNVAATVWIPTENEWFKAAYYDPTHMSGAGGYWLHANQSNSMTSNNFATAGAANYYDDNYAQAENSLPTSLTDAGAYGTDSQNYYGLDDMAGSVWEWNDLSGASGSPRGYRGGSWNDLEEDLRSSSRLVDAPLHGLDNRGFRLAGISGIPEPSTLVLTGLFGAGLVCRRKR